MESINSFSGGLNKDIAKTYQQASTYLDAQNIRIVTTEGQSTGIATNIRGNETFTSFPDTFPIYRLNIQYFTLGTTGYSQLTINIDNQSLVHTLLTTTVVDPNYIGNLIQNNTGTFTNLGITYNISFNLNDIYFYALTSSFVPPTIVGIYSLGGIPAGVAIPVVLYLDSIDSDDLYPIGYVVMRDEVYIWTCLNPNAYSNYTNSEQLSGQIWRLTYDPADTSNQTMTLMYNNQISLSPTYNIPTTGVKARYENDAIKRLYWSDFYNPVRTINIADPKAFAISPENLTLLPSVDLTIPTYKRTLLAAGATLSLGYYQCCYRLKSSSVATFFSELSDPVFLTDGNGPQYDEILYSGNANNSAAKNIVWDINNIDKDFERIETCVVYKQTLNGSPTIQIIKDEPIPTDGSYEFVFNGSELIEDLTINEFLQFQSSFTHAKTLEVKDNYLIAANVKNEDGLIDFDARAYRHKSNGEMAIYETLGDSSTKILGTSSSTGNYLGNYDLIPPTADAVNPDQYNPTTNIYHNDYQYKYQSNGTTLGGTGKWISYEFGCILTQGDASAELPGAAWDTVTGNGLYVTSPLIVPATASRDLTFDDENFLPSSGVWENYKNPVLSGSLLGYQREEIYRFGIQFFDKQGRPTFVNWIGDIKMPAMADTCPLANKVLLDGSPITDYPWLSSSSGTDFRTHFHAFNGSNPTCWLQHLYIKFTVDVPESLKNQISGYRIVRTVRKNEDKTILASGILDPIIEIPSSSPPTNSFCLPNLTAAFDFTGAAYAGPHTFGNTDDADADKLTTAYTYNSPEFQFGYIYGGVPYHNDGDKLRLVMPIEALNANDTTNYPTGQRQKVFKLYDTTNAPLNYLSSYTTGNLYSTTSIQKIDQGGTTTLQNTGGIFFNMVPMLSGGIACTYYYGGLTAVIETNTEVLLGAAGANDSNNIKILTYYTRWNVTQYGGLTYSNRTFNDFVPCGIFVKIEDSDFVSTKTINGTIYNTARSSPRTMGGDTYLTIYDDQKYVKNYGQSIPIVPGTPNAIGFALIYPVETTVNIDLRGPYHLNRDINNSGAVTNPVNIGDIYDVMPVVTTPNNVKTGVTKPLDFVPQNTFDNRIFISNPKLNGESSDSWRIFNTTANQETDSTYGPINAVINFNNQVYFLQDRGFGVIPINQREVIPGSVSELQVATAAGMQIPRYISTEVGTKHQNSVVSSNKSLYWFDIITKKMYRFAGDGVSQLSDIKGLHGHFIQSVKGELLTTDRPLLSINTAGDRVGILSTYDFKNNELLMTFMDYYTSTRVPTVFTTVYSETTQSYTSFYNLYPTLYINDYKHIMTVDPTNPHQIYIHKDTSNFGDFFGTTYPSSMSILVNKIPEETKVFNNVEWNTEVYDVSAAPATNIKGVTFDRVRFYTEYQNTDYQTLTNNSNIKRKERNWQMAVPRNLVQTTTSSASPNIFNSANFNATRLFKDRLRDRYVTVDLEYLNTNNYYFTFSWLKSIFLISPR